jgi:hypothetical protein
MTGHSKIPARMKALKTENLKIELRADLPARGVDGQDLAAFIVDALETWGGQRHPDDELFQSMSIKSVKIGTVRYNNPEPRKFRQLNREDID